MKVLRKWWKSMQGVWWCVTTCVYLTQKKKLHETDVLRSEPEIDFSEIFHGQFDS